MHSDRLLTKLCDIVLVHFISELLFYISESFTWLFFISDSYVLQLEWTYKHLKNN